MSTKYTIPFALHVNMDFGDAKDEVSFRMDGHYDVNVYDPEESRATWAEINVTVFDNEGHRIVYDRMTGIIRFAMEDKAIALAIKTHESK